MKENTQFLVQTYKGNEETILNLFNRNRNETQDRTYMDWRYLGEKSPIAPDVFFVTSGNSQSIGMLSHIFRAYWLENKKIYFAVGGDASIDEQYRGAKLGKKLIRYWTEYLYNELRTYGLVIGTPVAIKILAEMGWESVGKNVDYVFPLNIAEKILQKTHCKVFAKLFNVIYFNYISLVLKYSIKENLSLIDVDHFDSSFDALWDNLDKSDLLIRDRSTASLEWRYTKHPCLAFKKTKVLHENRLIGYIIHRVNSDNVLIIYDILFLEPKFIKSSLRLLLRRYCKHYKINSARIPLINEKHPYSEKFRKSGFILRKSDGDFRIFPPLNIENRNKLKFFFTLGDKDI